MPGAVSSLKKRRQWVVWKGVYIDEKDRWSKVPYNPKTGGTAKPNDPATWSDFETTRKAYEDENGKYHGIGFVLSSDDPYAGWDLDH